MPQIRVRVPPTAARGEVIEIRTLIQHEMETGLRRDETGTVIGEHIISDFTCTYAGEVVFQARFFPAVAANPYFAFHTVATESGTLVFSWLDDDGSVYSETAEIEVAG